MKQLTKKVISVLLAFLMLTSVVLPVSAADKTIYAVSTAHLDTVWSWELEKTLADYLPRTFYENFELFEEFPNYQFNFEGAYRYQLLEEYYPELFAQIRGYVDSGNWNVSGSGLENGDVNMPSPEALFRNFLLGNNYFDENFGVRSKDIYLPDCFGFGYALPSIAAHSNLLGFSTQKLSWGNTFKQGLPYDIGTWTGPDGESIVANINLNNYTDKFNSGVLNNSGIRNKLNNLDGKIPFVSALYGTMGDRGGGAPLYGSARAISAEMANNAINSVEVKFASTDTLFREVTPSQFNALTNYNGEFLMNTHGTGCYTSRALSKRWNRRGEVLADTAERSAVVADWLGYSEYNQEKFNDAWTRIIAHQFHDDLTGTSNSITYARSWNEYMISLMELAAEYENGAAGVIASMDTNVTSGVPVVVNNPLAVQRIDAVDAEVVLNSTLPYVRVYDANGNEVAAQVNSRNGSTYNITFIADVPALGYKTYRVVPSNVASGVYTGLSVQNNVLTSNNYRVTIDANGDISSVTDRTSNTEVLEAPVRLALFNMSGNSWPSWELNMGEYAWDTGDAYVQGNASVQVIENGPARVKLRVTRTYNGSTYMQDISLTADGKVVKVDNVVNWNEKGRLLKVEFNLNASNPTATYDLGLGVIQRQNNVNDNTTMKAEVPVQKWADITNTNGSRGTSIFNDGKYGMDKPDNNTIRLSAIYTPAIEYCHDGDSVGALYEYGPAGQELQDNGENRFSFGIYNHNGTFAQADTQIEAEAFNQPMSAFQTVEHDGALGDTYSFGSISNDRVLVRAVKKAENSDEIVIRVNEGAGTYQSNVEISLGNGIVSAREIYASEEAIGPATVRNGKLVFSLGAYDVKSFAVKLADPANPGQANDQAYVDLPYNVDVYSFNGNKADSTMDRVANAYPAEKVNEIETAAGVSYKMGNTENGKNNAVKANGQTITLPQGYTTLKILAASLDGDKNAQFKVDSKTVTLNIADFSENVAAWDLKDLGMTGYVKQQTPAVVTNHRHSGGEDNQAATTYMFSYTLDITGAKTVTLPQDGDIIVFAATAVDESESKATCVTQQFDQRERAAATPDSGKTLFYTGFESGDTAVRTGYMPNTNNTDNRVCDYTTERVRSGSRALKFSGNDTSANGSFAYATLAENLNLTVEPGTTLTYDMYVGNNLGRYVAIDFEFDTGYPLRDRQYVFDRDGVQAHPQTGRGKVGQWVTVTIDLSERVAGRTIKRIMVAYDHGADTGEYVTYIDNLRIETAGTGAQKLNSKLGTMNRGLYSATSLAELDAAVATLHRFEADNTATASELDYACDQAEKAYDALALYKNAYGTNYGRDFDEKRHSTISVERVNGEPANLGWIEDSAYIIHKDVDFGTRGASSITLRYSGASTGNNNFAEIRLDNDHGKLLSTIQLPQTSDYDWSTYTNVTGELNTILTGEEDICIVFRSTDGSNVCNFDSFTFTQARSGAALRQLVNEVKTIDTTGMPASKLSALNTALRNAESVLAKSNASDSEYNGAYEALEAAVEALDSVLIGDVDQDGSVNVADILKLKVLILANLWTDEELSIGDLNGNNRLDAGDIMAVKKIIMGM